MWTWWKDLPLRTTVLVAGLLRVIPMLVWVDKPCVRDECTYIDLADAILNGDGMVGTHGWLWAPAYPVLLAAHETVSGYPGTVQVTQLFMAMCSVVWLNDLAREQGGVRAGRIAGWMYALNPTLIFYTTSLWSETLYSGLLLGAMLALRWARSGDERRGWLPGLLVGLCVLFRGVATYMLPIFFVALLWERWRERAAWRGVVACGLVAVLTVAPYSLYASQKWGAFVVADRTLGQMMYLGNNNFPPITFDTGNGALSERAYERATLGGRGPCPPVDNPVVKDDCEAAAGMAWIRANPGPFLARMPERVAQLVNPHSFLTRHLRWGRWHGLPQWLDEAFILAVVGFSFVTLVVGTLGWFARGRGWYGATAGLIVLYHVAAIAVLAGLTRYRVPLEPLWLVFAGGFLAEPRASWRRLGNGSARSVVGIFVTVVLLALMLRYLPAGWPTWRSW